MDDLSTPELFARHVIPTYGRFPLSLARGQGSRVWDESGREYLDFGAGIAVCSLGHAHPALTAALAEQAARLSHTSNLYYTRPQAALARRLSGYVGAPGKCFFCNSGAEANEALYKLARKFGNETGAGGRSEIVTFHNSFHGRTLAGIAATGQEKVRRGFEPLTPGFRHAYINDLASVAAALTEKTAAILVEPIQGEIGVAPCHAEFLTGLRRLCDKRDLLLMYDEVQCGFGRTGDWCAWQTTAGAAAAPDAISWAKGMAGGFPMGAIWVRDRPVDGPAGTLGDVLGPGSHGTTFGGNLLGCACATAVFDTIEAQDLLANAAARGAQAVEGLRALASPYIKEVRSIGLMVGIEWEAGPLGQRLGLEEGDRALSLQMVDRLQAAGLLAVPSGVGVLRWLPPLNVSASEIDQALQITQGVLKSL